MLQKRLVGSLKCTLTSIRLYSGSKANAEARAEDFSVQPYVCMGCKDSCSEWMYSGLTDC